MITKLSDLVLHEGVDVAMQPPSNDGDFLFSMRQYFFGILFYPDIIGGIVRRIVNEVKLQGVLKCPFSLYANAIIAVSASRFGKQKTIISFVYCAESLSLNPG